MVCGVIPDIKAPVRSFHGSASLRPVGIGCTTLDGGAHHDAIDTLARPPAPEDVQARVPAVRVGLSRVGVTGVEKVVRIRDELFFARLECFVDLSHDQKGAHMSRFEEVVNEAIGEVVLSQSQFRAETLARNIAELVRERQGASAGGGDGTGALPRAQAGPRLRCFDAGDLHAPRPRRGDGGR